MPYSWKWSDGNPPKLDCDFRPKCRYHKDTYLQFNNVALILFPVTENGVKHMGTAVDVHLRCPHCGWHKLFGVAAPEDIWRKLNERKNIGTQEPGVAQDV